MSEEATGSDQFNIVTEIENAIRIIDYAAEQGAFKGWETIKQVIGVRERLLAFNVAVSQTLAEADVSDDATTEPAAVAVAEAE